MERFAQIPDDETVDAIIRLLDSLAANRSQLDEIDPDRRVALLVAAGRLSRPLRHEIIRASKVRRRRQRRESDSRVFAATEIRTARRSSVLVPPPLRLTAGDGDLSADELKRTGRTKRRSRGDGDCRLCSGSTAKGKLAPSITVADCGPWQLPVALNFVAPAMDATAPPPWPGPKR